MVQSAESEKGLNPAYKRRADRDWPARGRVLREPEMRPVLMVVAHVLGHKPLEMPFIQRRWSAGRDPPEFAACVSYWS
jgi:hypothetical protein